MTPLYLVALIPPGARPPFTGQRVRWPDESQEWVWDGERWVGQTEERWIEEW